MKKNRFKEQLPFTYDKLTNPDSLNKGAVKAYSTYVTSSFHHTKHYLVYGHYKPISRMI
ncbi:MAG: hypothetical protein ACHQRM_16775 [Bacteroidia bacterium]